MTQRSLLHVSYRAPCAFFLSLFPFALRCFVEAQTRSALIYVFPYHIVSYQKKLRHLRKEETTSTHLAWRDLGTADQSQRRDTCNVHQRTRSTFPHGHSYCLSEGTSDIRVSPFRIPPLVYLLIRFLFFFFAPARTHTN